MRLITFGNLVMCLSILVCFTSCTATVAPKKRQVTTDSNDSRYYETVRDMAETFKGRSIDDLLTLHPDAESVVLDIANNKFRYYVRVKIPCNDLVVELARMRDSLRYLNCWIDVYYFAENGVVTHYTMSEDFSMQPRRSIQ